MQDLVIEISAGGEDVENRGYNNDLPLRTKFPITLWWLANQETFRQVADQLVPLEVTFHPTLWNICFNRM